MTASTHAHSDPNRSLLSMDKKRVTLLVDATTVTPDQPVFNFGGFQSTDACTARDEDDATTSYQHGRKSIVEGLSASDLLHMHRKSLAQLSHNTVPGATGGVNPDAFTGVTLSRRHRTTDAEYAASRDAEAAVALESFSFGSSE